MSPTHLEFFERPLAFFITFGTYGTWLHGDARGSIDRFHNRYGTPRLPPNDLRERYERSLLKRRPLRLSQRQRKVVMDAIKEISIEKAWGVYGQSMPARHMYTPS